MNEIIKTKVLEGDNLISLLSTAFYGSEWFYATRSDKYENLIRPQSECREEKWADILKGGGSIVVVDVEDEESEHEINLNDIVRALAKISVEYPKVYGRVMCFDGSADFYDCDCVIQFAVYGDWIYG